MKEYHKINSPFKRDDRGKFLVGEWAQPEFEYLQNNLWSWTEKIDGTNIRIIWDGQSIQFGGKTDNAQLPTKLLKNLVDHFHGQWKPGVELFKEAFGTDGNVCLYGEGYGASIQKGGGNYSSEQWFILFDVKIGDFWLSRDNILDIANKLGLDVVDSYGIMTLNQRINVIKTLQSVKSSMFPNTNVEGFVGTPVVPLFTRKGERIITKIKFKDFNNGWSV